MPIFFFIDPEFSKDPTLIGVDTVILSYTFFAAKNAGAFLKGLSAQPPTPPQEEAAAA